MLFEDRRHEVRARGPSLPGAELGLERREEGLGDGVVPAVTLTDSCWRPAPTDASDSAVVGARVLAAAVGVVQEP